MWRQHAVLLVALIARVMAFVDSTDLDGDLDFASGSGEYVAKPPSSPPLPDGPQIVLVAFSASGDVSSYSSNVIDSLESTFALTAGVGFQSVTVTVASGSVIINVAIETASSSASDRAVAALLPSVQTPSALTMLLSSIPGIAIYVDEITAPLSVAAMPSPPAPASPPSSPPASGGLPIGAVAGIVVGSVFALALAAVIAYKFFVNIRDSPGHASLSPVKAVEVGQLHLTANKQPVDVV